MHINHIHVSDMDSSMPSCMHIVNREKVSNWSRRSGGVAAPDKSIESGGTVIGAWRGGKTNCDLSH